jgi:ribokinase
MSKKILIVGSLNMDLVVQIETMPMVGETILGRDVQYFPGGKGANQACASGKLGGQATMLGCVGADGFGNSLLQSLANANINTEHIEVKENIATGMAFIYVDTHGSNSIVVVSGANSLCNTEYLKNHDQEFMDCDILIIQMEIAYDAVYYAIERAFELGKTVILNPAPAPKEIPDDILKKIDYITPNEGELARLSGKKCDEIQDIHEGARVLLDKGVKNVLVTIGDRGSVLVNKEGIRQFETRKVIPVDTTAAGDCFNGAFAVAVAEGKQPDEAVVFANFASSIEVTRAGAQASIPTRDEVDALISQEV